MNTISRFRFAKVKLMVEAMRTGQVLKRHPILVLHSCFKGWGVDPFLLLENHVEQFMHFICLCVIKQSKNCFIAELLNPRQLG